MTTVSTKEIEHNMPSLLARLRDGETVLLEHEGMAVATLAPVPAAKPNIDLSRRLGFLVGKGSVPDNWKELGREEIEREFYGEE